MEKKYSPRIIEKKLRDLLSAFGAVWIKGPKWCGKTETGLKNSNSVIFMEDYKNNEAEIVAINNNLLGLLKKPTPLLIDEWNEFPKIWDIIRREIDKRSKPSQFILTSSMSKIDFTNIVHNGAGRIASLTMRPMTLFESGFSDGLISLSKVNEEIKNKIYQINNINLKDIVNEICVGGWPYLINNKPEDNWLKLSVSQQYIESIISNGDLLKNTYKISTHELKSILQSAARLVGSNFNLLKIQKDLNLRLGLEIDRKTVGQYLMKFYDLYMLENLKSWNFNIRSSAKTLKSDTLYFVDPSLATALLNVNPTDLLKDTKTLGFMFENLCIRDLNVYAQANNATIYKYRDYSDFEIDCIVKFANNSLGLIEIKLGSEEGILQSCKNLSKFEKYINDSGKDYTVKFKMVLTAVGNTYVTNENVLITPLSTLKD